MKKRQYKQKNMTACPSKYPQKFFKDKGCRECGKSFTPKAPSHLYCSDVCKDISYTNSYFTKQYGITYNEVLKLLEKQNGVCVICKEVGFKMHPNSWSGLNVDHDHETGEVRGLLCHNCNRALGLFKDDKLRLLNAISYLEGATTIPKGSRAK